jgi:hypothetical protein
MIDFQTARTIVAKATGHKTEAFGWENNDVFLVPIDWGDEFPELDAPTRLVDKKTGELDEVYGCGVRGIDAAPNLRPIGEQKAFDDMVVTKSVDAIVESVESEHPNGEFIAVLTNEALDRDDENLWADEWKQPLPARIHIDGDHGRSLDKTVGSAVPTLDGNRMIGKGTYAGTPYAQMVRQLVNEGHINSLSVTYAEHKNQKDGGIQRELLNAAFVAIPANPEAIVLSSKAAKVDKADGGVGASGNNPDVKHDDMVQAIHDAATHLGAQCMNEVEADPGTADGANKSGPTGTIKSGLITDIPETFSPDGAGLPQESAEESAAAVPAEKSAGSAAADESADDIAVKVRLRALKYLTEKSNEHA